MKRIVNITAMALAVAFLFGLTLLAQPTTSMAQTGDRYFSETGHNVPAIFYQYWLSHGGLEQQGYPTVRLASAKGFRVLETRRSGD